MAAGGPAQLLALYSMAADRLEAEICANSSQREGQGRATERHGNVNCTLQGVGPNRSTFLCDAHCTHPWEYCKDYRHSDVAWLPPSAHCHRMKCSQAVTCLIGILTDLIFQRELATRTPVVVFDGWQGPAASLATAGCGRLPPLPHQAARLLYYACMTMGQPPPTFSPPMRGCLEYASRPLRRSLTLPLPTHAVLPAVLSALHLQGRRPGGDGAPQQTRHAPDRQPARQPCGSGRRLVRGERGADIRPQNYPLFAH